MEKPDCYGWTTDGTCSLCNNYNEHIASLKQFPTTGFSETDDGKEFGEGEFEVRYEIRQANRPGAFQNCAKTIYAHVDLTKWERRIIAVRISKPQEKEGGVAEFKVEYKDHDKVVLTNRQGDTYTSKSEELMDFLHDSKSFTPLHTSAGGEAVKFAEWQNEYFELTENNKYRLQEYASVAKIEGVLFGEHYSMDELYKLFLKTK